MIRQTSRDYTRPYRRWPVWLFDRLGPGASLAPESLLSAARRAEGLEDFGDPDPGPLLERLLDSIESEASLTRAGRWITRIRLVDLLRVRLRMQRLVRNHPEIREVELPPIVAIVGLQRTGTTLLHRLLAAAPGARSVRSWEAINPVPFQTGADPATRIRKAQTAARALRWLAPDFFAVHPVDPEAPEEEVVLLDQSMYATVAEATLRVPTWSRWLEAQDQSAGYAYLRQALQVLQWQSPGTHLVLKTPHHLEWLDVLLDTFPGTHVVMTHRDPVQTQASFCSMVAHGRGLTSDAVDPVEIGQEWLRKCTRLLERALTVRDRLDESRFLDVRYDDLLADPMATCRQVHAHAALPWSEQGEASISAQLEAAPQHRWGRHVYRAEDFGLSDASIRTSYADYRARFGFDRE